MEAEEERANSLAYLAAQLPSLYNQGPPDWEWTVHSGLGSLPASNIQANTQQIFPQLMDMRLQSRFLLPRYIKMTGAINYHTMEEWYILSPPSEE